VILGNISRGHTDDGIQLNGADYNVVVGNRCLENTDYGINLGTADKNTIVGNTCRLNYSNGIVCHSDSNFNVVTGNTCADNSGHAIATVSNSDNVISGNIARAGNNLHGIFIEDSQRITIEGNIVSECTGANRDGIHLDNADNCLVANNQIYGNTRYGIMILSGSTENQIQGNYTQGNGTACLRIDNANALRNIITGNCFDEGDISDVGGAHFCVAYLNYDPSAGAMITTINPPLVVGGGGGALP